MKLRTIACAAFALAATTLLADTTPVMGSLFTPVQAPSSDYDVKGFRLSLIYGEGQNFTGLDLGIAQRSYGEFVGLGIGGANIVDGRFRGGQLGLVNWDAHEDQGWETRSCGAQVGLVNYAGSFCGLQQGLVNITKGAFAGFQHGLFNSANDMYGLQCGPYLFLAVNYATGTVRGAQIGIVNYAAKMESGLQVGLVNIIDQNGWMPVLPIVNGQF